MLHALVLAAALASSASGATKNDAAIAVERACPVMQRKWPEREIKCSELEARHESYGWIVYRKGAVQHLHPGPVARLNKKLRLIDTVYLDS